MNKSIKKVVYLLISLGLLAVLLLIGSNKKYEYPPISTDIDIQIYLPTYIPDGYELQDYEIIDSFVSATFCSETQELYYTQIESDNFSLSLDTERHKITEYTSDRFDGYICEKETVPGAYSMYLYDEYNYYELRGVLEKEEIIKVAESIEKYIP